MKLFKLFIALFVFASCNNFSINATETTKKPHEIYSANSNLQRKIISFLQEYKNMLIKTYKEFKPEDPEANFAPPEYANKVHITFQEHFILLINHEATQWLEKLKTILNGEKISDQERDQIREKVTEKLNYTRNIFFKDKKGFKKILSLMQADLIKKETVLKKKFGNDDVVVLIKRVQDSFTKCTACQKAPKNYKLFKCSKCLSKEIYYCSQECQKMHWKTHKLNCNHKNNPASATAGSTDNNSGDLGDSKDNLDNTADEPKTTESNLDGYKESSTVATQQCDALGCQTTENLKKCSKCKLVSYCSKECQMAHWDAHKPDCKKNRAKNTNIINTDTIIEEVD